LLLGAVSLAAAQSAEQGEAEQNPLAVESLALLADIEKSREEGRELVSRIENLQGEDRLVVERELAAMRIKILQDLDRLAGNVVAMEQQGLDTAGLRKPVEMLMKEVPPVIQRLADETAARVSELRIQREDLEIADLLQHEKEIAESTAYTDMLVATLYEHARKMEALGLDAGKERDYLVDRLTDRAKSLSERIAIAQEYIATVELRLSEAPDDADAKIELDAAGARLEGAIANLDATVDVLNKLGVETAEYKQQLIKARGQIGTEILDTQVAIGLAGQWLKTVRLWLVDNGPRLIFKVIVIILILLAFRILANVARRIIKRSLAASKFKVSKLLEEMITSMAAKTVMVFGLLVALAQLGVSLGPLLAGLGVAGFIVGFALQDTLSNFASGMMILFYRPFDVGDLVEAGGVFGKVSAMTLVSTTFLTLDHQTLVVPNSKIWGDVIKNVTAQKVRRVDMTFGIAYSDDIPHAEKVLRSILEENELVLDDPEPMVHLHNLGDSSVDFVVRPWCKTDDYWDVYWEVTREVKMRFDREGINIPFPQRDVHLYEEKRATA
jgi:small conductance mechanosensitive channel